MARIGESFPARQRAEETAAYSEDGAEAYPQRATPQTATPQRATSAEAAAAIADAPPVVHFAQSTSRLAGLLKANLATPVAESPKPQQPGVSSRVEAFPLSSVRHPQVAAEEANGRSSGDEATEEGAALSVEAVMEELYERLRLEFLRTYGTSGE